MERVGKFVKEENKVLENFKMFISKFLIIKKVRLSF